MSSLLLNNDLTFVDKTKRESGDKSCPIWLLLNPRNPEDTSNIWNPILYEIQDMVYRKLHARINSKNIFITYAVSDIVRVPNTSVDAELPKNVEMLRESVLKHQPKLIFTFGAITNEFVRRVFYIKPENGSKYWSTSNLGDEFERSIANFNINQINWIPLVRRIPKSCKNLKDWEESNNYYRDAASKIADKMIENKDSLKIWI